jgi:pyruvate formate lyase activating enzyme
MLELVLFDIKHINPVDHNRITGKSNQMILNNLSRIIGLGKEVIIRFPFIPGFNDSRESISALGTLLKEMGLKRIDILPYHRLGISKYKGLGLSYMLVDVKVPSDEDIDEALKQLESFDLQVSVG